MKKVKLGEVLSLKKGKKATVLAEQTTLSQRYIQIDDLRNNNNLKFTESLNMTEALPDDILIAWDGANAGTVGYGLSGAGSLYIDETKTTRLLDTPDFPEEFKPLAKAQADELDLLRTKNNLNWTFVSPAVDFIPDGEKTGNYILAGEIFTTNEKGISQISYADYAIGLVDELEKGHHIKERISLLEK